MKMLNFAAAFLVVAVSSTIARADVVIKGAGGSTIYPDGSVYVCPLSSDATCATVTKATTLAPGMQNLQLNVEGGNTYTVNVVEVNGKQAPDGSYQGNQLVFQISNQ